jgi:hypothetical protein
MGESEKNLEEQFISVTALLPRDPQYLLKHTKKTIPTPKKKQNQTIPTLQGDISRHDSFGRYEMLKTRHCERKRKIDEKC